MPRSRLQLFTYDVVRELCDTCSKERFHFVPTGAAPAPGTCPRCGSERKLAEISDAAIMRLVTQSDREVVVMPIT